LLIAGPDDADRSVLLLPGGANAARSFDLVMAAPVLSGVRLVATTLPGMAGAPLRFLCQRGQAVAEGRAVATGDSCCGSCRWWSEKSSLGAVARRPR